MALTLDPSVRDAIHRHGAETYPHECCGALIGRRNGEDASVTHAFALPNTTEEGPRRHFLVRPSDYRQAEARASALDGELLGFYHSHPDHPARPSQYDLDHAWPFFSYVIVSVREGAPGDTTSWRLRDDRSQFDPETLILRDTALRDTALRDTALRSTAPRETAHGEQDPDPDPAAALHR